MEIFRAIAVGLIFAAPVRAQDPDAGLVLAHAGDYVTALENRQALAKQGDIQPKYNLDNIYFTGNGVLKNLAEAPRWYRIAAKQSDASIKTNLGGIFAFGDRSPQYYVSAHMWGNISAATALDDRNQLCDVKVTASTKPVYLILDGKEVFFVRRGGASRPLALAAEHPWNKRRF